MTEEELIAALGDEPGDIVLCGASHEAFMRDVGDVKIVSVGSVGEAPGGGYAHATLINTAQMGFEVIQFTVDLT
jgi:predicted phosphodiesterase